METKSFIINYVNPLSSDWTEPTNNLGQLFYFKLDRFVVVQILLYIYVHSYLVLKTRPTFCPVSIDIREYIDCSLVWPAGLVLVE
jgi:hypothetical protein